MQFVMFYMQILVCTRLIRKVLDLADFHFIQFFCPLSQKRNLKTSIKFVSNCKAVVMKKTFERTVLESLRSSKKDLQINVILSPNNFNKKTKFLGPELKMSNYTTLSFKFAVRGFHFYSTCQQPQKNEILNCFHETSNPFDTFAIQVSKLETNKRVGHLPMVIFRVTNFLLDRRAVFQAN